jgi:hypothetical protein
MKSRSLFTSAAFTSHPLARREPLPPRQRLVGRFELSRPRPDPRELPRASPCRRERCVSPTSATDLRHEHPCTLPDSRPRSPSRHAVLRPRDVPARADPPSTAGSGLRLLQHPTMNHQVELRLTANLQLRLRCNPPDRASEPEPRCTIRFEHCAFLGKLRSRAPPRRASRSRRSRPPTGHTARPLTSSVATAPLGLDLSASPASTAARLRFHSRPVKGDRFSAARVPSADDFSPTSAIRTAHEHNHEPSDPSSTSPTWLVPLAQDRQG